MTRPVPPVIPGPYVPSAGDFFAAVSASVNEGGGQDHVRVNFDDVPAVGGTLAGWSAEYRIWNNTGDAWTSIALSNMVIDGVSAFLEVDLPQDVVTYGHDVRVSYDGMVGDIMTASGDRLGSFTNLVATNGMEMVWIAILPTPQNHTQGTPIPSLNIRPYSDDPDMAYEFIEWPGGGSPGMPPGISLNSVTPGVFDGTPTTAGSYPNNLVRARRAGSVDTFGPVSSRIDWEIQSSGPGNVDNWVDETDDGMVDETDDQFEFITFD